MGRVRDRVIGEGVRECVNFFFKSLCLKIYFLQNQPRNFLNWNSYNQ